MRLSYTGIIGGKALIKFSILLNSDNSQKSVQIWSNFAQKVFSKQNQTKSGPKCAPNPDQYHRIGYLLGFIRNFSTFWCKPGPFPDYFFQKKSGSGPKSRKNGPNGSTAYFFWAKPVIRSVLQCL